jgi:hypothetical protein
MYTDLKERPETIIKRYYGDLFDRQEIGIGADLQPSIDGKRAAGGG